MPALDVRPVAPLPAASEPSPAAVLATIGGRRNRRARTIVRWFLILAVLAAGGVAAFYWFHRAPVPPSYRMAAVDRGDIVTSVTATGTLQPKSVVAVGGEISGRVASVAVEVNDRVTKGQVLATLDPESLDNALAEAKAALVSAKADVARSLASREQAKLAASRIDDLAARGLASAEEREGSDSAHALAKADYSRAVAQRELAAIRVDQAQTNRTRTVISAPIDGVVLTRTVEPGNAISASLAAPELFRLAEDLAQMELHLGIDEADVGRVIEGQAATFTVDAYPGRRFDATVRKVYLSPVTTETATAVVTYTAVMRVDNSSGLLRPGMTATATISTERHPDVMRVPNVALRFSPQSTEQKADAKSTNPFTPPMPGRGRMGGGGGARRPGNTATGPSTDGTGRVWVLRDGEPQALRVKLGASDGRFTEISSDELHDGDEVIVAKEQAPS